MHCENCNSYQIQFDEQRAREELDNYKSTGPKKMTRPLVDLLKQQQLDGLSLLDIGGGIGAISFELMDAGISETNHVEISKGSLKIFQEEIAQRGWRDRSQIFDGDFLDLAKAIPTADIVALDKVICCYPHFKDLVSNSLSKCKKYYAFVIPRDVWWVHIGETIDSWIRTLKGKAFKSYIHPVAEIEQMVMDAGFKKLGSRHQREWLIAVFEKVDKILT